jgi:hypothetical protein
MADEKAKPVLESPTTFIHRMKEALQEGSMIDIIKKIQKGDCKLQKAVVYPCFLIAFAFVHVVLIYSIIQYVRIRNWNAYEQKVSDTYSLKVIPIKDTTSYKLLTSTNILFYVIMFTIPLSCILMMVALGSFTTIKVASNTSSCLERDEEKLYGIGYMIISLWFLLRLSLLMSYILYTIYTNIKKAKKEITRFNQMILTMVKPEVALTKSEKTIENVIGDVFRKVNSQVSSDDLAKWIFSVSLYKYYRQLYKNSTENKDIQYLSNALQTFAIQAKNTDVVTSMLTQKALPCYEYINKGPFTINILYDTQMYNNYMSHIPIKTFNDATLRLQKFITTLKMQHEKCRIALSSKQMDTPIQSLHLLMINILPWVFYSLPLTILFVKLVQWLWRFATGKK